MSSVHNDAWQEHRTRQKAIFQGKLQKVTLSGIKISSQLGAPSYSRGPIMRCSRFKSSRPVQIKIQLPLSPVFGAGGRRLRLGRTAVDRCIFMRSAPSADLAAPCEEGSFIVSRSKPLLLIDVDGPLNPYAAKATRRPAGYQTHRIPMKHDLPAGLPYADMSRPAARSTLRVWLNPAHGAMLLAMTDLFDLHWATAWVEDANRIVAPLIGLPELPVIHWDDYAPLTSSMTVLPPYEQTLSAHLGGSRRSVEMVHWKTRPIARYTAGRPFIWMDDEHTDADRHHLAVVGSVGRHLLHRIDPTIGMTAADLDIFRDWAETL